MAETKAKPVTKAERKKPVRSAPVQKDYSSKLEWLKAMTEYETKQSEVASAAKVARLDKRIAAAKAARDEAVAKVAALITERDKLVPDEAGDVAMDDEPELVADGHGGWTQPA